MGNASHAPTQHGLLSSPERAKDVLGGAANGLRFGSAVMQGYARENNVAVSVLDKVPGHDTWSAFAVFDGHGGRLVAEMMGLKLLPALVRHFPAEISRIERCESILLLLLLR